MRKVSLLEDYEKKLADFRIVLDSKNNALCDFNAIHLTLLQSLSVKSTFSVSKNDSEFIECVRSFVDNRSGFLKDQHQCQLHIDASNYFQKMYVLTDWY